MIVVDASAAVHYLTDSRPAADRVRARLSDQPLVHVPELFDIEVLHALRGLERGGRLDARRLRGALDGLDELRALRHPHRQHRPRMWALRHNLSPYDAAYVALAESLDAELLTTDRRLAAAPGNRATIELVA